MKIYGKLAAHPVTHCERHSKLKEFNFSTLQIWGCFPSHWWRVHQGELLFSFIFLISINQGFQCFVRSASNNIFSSVWMECILNNQFYHSKLSLLFPCWIVGLAVERLGNFGPGGEISTLHTISYLISKRGKFHHLTCSLLPLYFCLFLLLPDSVKVCYRCALPYFHVSFGCQADILKFSSWMPCRFLCQLI